MRDGHGIAWAGLAVFLVVVLHKPFDSLTLGTLMAVGGRSVRHRRWAPPCAPLSGRPLGIAGNPLVGTRRRPPVHSALASVPHAAFRLSAPFAD
jgi:hypothetical protein